MLDHLKEENLLLTVSNGRIKSIRTNERLNQIEVNIIVVFSVFVGVHEL